MVSSNKIDIVSTEKKLMYPIGFQSLFVFMTLHGDVFCSKVEKQ
jgi:hypothetical protein